MNSTGGYKYSTSTDRVPPALRKAILERDGYRCVKCGFYSPERLGLLHIDHKHPKSLGGPTVPENLRVLCGDCNLKRRNKVPECPNCGQWVVEDKPFCPSCRHTLPQHAGLVGSEVKAVNTSSLLDRLRQMSPLRKLIFVCAVGMIGFGLTTFAVTGVAWVWSSVTNRCKATKQTGGAGESCTLVDASGRANLKTKCDSTDFDNDPSTVVGKIQAGSSVRKTGTTVSSSLPAVGT